MAANVNHARAGGRAKGVGNKDKWFAAALRAEVAATGKDHKALRLIARKLLDEAASGDVQAINSVRDTLDGKPAQQLDVGGGDNSPIRLEISWAKPKQ